MLYRLFFVDFGLRLWNRNPSFRLGRILLFDRFYQHRDGALSQRGFLFVGSFCSRPTALHAHRSEQEKRQGIEHETIALHLDIPFFWYRREKCALHV
jgi:hypothetical protein